MAIKNFRIIDEGPIKKAESDDVPSLMVIAGPNGVGKSTLIETLHKESEPRQRRHHDETHVEFENKDSKCVYFTPHRSPDQGSVSLQNLIQSQEYSFAELLAERNPDLRGVRTPRRTKASSDQIPYNAVKRRLATFKRKRRDVLEELHEEYGDVASEMVPSLAGPLQDALQKVLPGIEFIGVEYNDNDKYVLQFKNNIGDIVSFDELSSGEKDAISMLFLLVENEIAQEYEEAGVGEVEEDNIIVLIDGPEAHLHHDLQRRFIQYLSDYLSPNKGEEGNQDIQFIIATHSKAILDYVPLDSIFFLRANETDIDNQLQSASELDTDKIGEMMGDMGIVALSSGRHLLLVEGPTDREVLSQFYPSLEEEFTILPMKGKDRIKDISSFNELLKELVSTGREVFAILDKDREGYVDSDLNSRVHVLPCTCIENLVLKPDAIYSAVESWVGKNRLESTGIETPEEIEGLISEIISDEEFKREEVWARYNEEFNPLNVSRKEFYHRPESDFEQYAFDKVRDQLDQTSDIEAIREEVDELVANDEWDQLDGKRIVQKLSTEFRLDQERFARIVAKEMEYMGTQPENTTEFIEDIMERVKPDR